MVRDGKDAAKKLLDKSISEFHTNMKNSKDDRSLAMISDADAAKTISGLLRSQLPEEERQWVSALVEDSWGKQINQLLISLRKCLTCSTDCMGSTC